MSQRNCRDMEIDGDIAQFAQSQNVVDRKTQPLPGTGNPFIPTRAFFDAQKHLQDRHVVFLIGGPGEGKTMILQNLSRTMEKNGYTTVSVGHPEDIVSSRDMGSRILFVCDDIFGRVYPSRDKIKAWAESLLPDLSICNPSCDVKIAISCCSRIWKQYQADFGHVSLFQNPVCVSSSKLTGKEKVEMIQAHFVESGTVVDSNNISLITSVTDAVAFPYCCRMVATEYFGNKSGHYINNFADVFRNPANILCPALKRLEGQSKVAYFTMILLAFSDGTLSNSELINLLQKEKTLTLFRALFAEDIDGYLPHFPQNVARFICSESFHFLKFVEDEEGEWLFSIPDHIVLNTIIQKLAGTNINEIVEYAPPDFIVEKCRLKTCSPCETMDDGCIWLDPDAYTAFASVVTEEVIRGNAPHVFSNPAVEDTAFQTFWINYLKQLSIEKQVSFANSHFLRYFVSQLKEKEFMQYVMERSSARPAEGYDFMLVLYRAAIGGQFIMLSKMKKGKLNVMGENSQSACSFVSLLGKPEALATLLRFGCNPNILDIASKKSPLHHAVERGHGKLVEILIDFGADVNIADKDNVRPLHLAACRGSVEIAEALINAQAVVDVRDRWGTTPLHHAAEQGQEDVTRLLVEYGASIRLQDANHQTALHFAAKSGNPAVFSLLQLRGGDIQQKDVWGKAAMDYAKKNER
ncbi:uncharacterized protein LOC135471236 isoform X2 [Liolophura sinensis]